ncbi:Cyst wall protein, type 1A [Carpediemonas membranifera]|uniref:Cyst wall protein, type 1A n=1 Tax=Carpediemonas membranifera TaxID=201153 RepID=A0A8J6B2R9_9EUKA|nr:Cyst wall protein, type 1A [Carpediemonas membranifera]|eukprot:KAG9394488.1 Cyst wall protein, type 1A [Carpediemonas membranifera]
MKFGTTLVVLGLIATVFAQCVITEEEALMNMYVALGGDSWTDNTNWNTGDVCTWYGIGCNIDGYVVSIDLSNNNLVGLPHRRHRVLPLPSRASSSTTTRSPAPSPTPSATCPASSTSTSTTTS